MLELLDQQQKLTATSGNRARRDTRRHARFLRFLPDWVCAGIHCRGLAPDLRAVGDHPPRLRHQRAFGSLFWGWMADKIGRRKVMIATVLNFSLATGAMAVTPDGAWITSSCAASWSASA